MDQNLTAETSRQIGPLRHVSFLNPDIQLLFISMTGLVLARVVDPVTAHR